MSRTLSGSSSRQDHKFRWKRLFGPALYPLLDRIDQHRRERGGEDDRTLAAAVAVIIVDDLLQAIGCAGEHRRHRQVISATLADRLMTNSASYSRKRSRAISRPSCRISTASANVSPANSSTSSWWTERADGHFVMSHDRGQRQEQRVAGEAEQRPADLLPLRSAAFAGGDEQRQDAGDHEARRRSR